MLYQEIYLFLKDFEICSDDNVKCETGEQVPPDPIHYGLPEDFIYVENDWGSFFYKHFGKRTRLEAKSLCSEYQDYYDIPENSRHLPIPRFQEENEFYRNLFASKGLWLDISYDKMKGYESSYGHSFISDFYAFDQDIKSVTKYNGFDIADYAEIKYHDWITIDEWMEEWETKKYAKSVYMTNTGKWNVAGENDLFDAVCVFNIVPDTELVRTGGRNRRRKKPEMEPGFKMLKMSKRFVLSICGK